MTQATPLSEEELAGAVFAKDSVFTPKAETRQRSIGAVARDFGGYGLSYNHPIADTRTLWSAITYSPFRIVVGNHNPAATVSIMAQEKNLLAIMFGADQTLNPFNRRYWSFLLGVGAGLQSGRFETKVFRQQCLDPDVCVLRDRKDINVQDNFVFAFWRFGITVREFRIAGQKAGFIFAIMPMLARLPKYAEISMFDGAKGKLGENQSQFLMEFNLEI